MGRKIPIFDMHDGYSTTTDIQLAMHNNYIGEVYITPTKLSEAIGKIIGNRYFRGTIFYYGAPDDELKMKFGYT